jgi:aminocarboxymuconate-semialdehyde decarboxylase
LRVIDCHAHFVPEVVLGTIASGTYPGVRLEGDRDTGLCCHVPGLAPSPPLPSTITDAAAAIAWQAEHGIDRQLLSPWTDLLGYTLPEGEATTWSHRYNEALVEVAATSDRFGVLGTVPLGQPQRAVEVLEQAADIGCSGLMIGTAAPEVELDDPRLDELWAAAADRAMPVVVHPIFLTRDPRLRAYSLPNAVGRANETAIAISRLLFGGVLLRHPGLRLVVVHGGATIPALLPRLRRNHEVFAADAADPDAGFERLYFDSVVLDPSLLRALVDLTGPDRIVLGSDYPFPWEPDPRRVVDEAGLAPEVADAILGGTAAALFEPVEVTSP